MRLPYAQVAMEIIEVSAPEMSVELGISEAEAGWGLLKLIPWGLARCPDHEPPSENDVVEGPNAARLIARAVGYAGDAEAYVNAGERLRYPIFERLAYGIRLRGLDRYDPAWGGNHRKLWALWQEFWAGNAPRPGSPCEYIVNAEEKPCPDADADADADATSKAPVAGDKRPPVVRIKKPSDPRVVELQKHLSQDYEHIRGEPYRNAGAADVLALKTLQALADDVSIRRRWIAAIQAPRAEWVSCSTVAQLARKWNDLAAPSGGFDPDQGILSHQEAS